MDLLLEFVRLFFLAASFVWPLLLGFVVLIVVLGLVIGKREGWSRLDAVYFAFVSATTVGFGDLHPGDKISKILSIVIALLGLIFTGIVIAIALHAANYSFKHSPAFSDLTRTLERIESEQGDTR
jgi:voltage-gated potassium channel